MAKEKLQLHKAETSEEERFAHLRKNSVEDFVSIMDEAKYNVVLCGDPIEIEHILEEVHMAKERATEKNKFNPDITQPLKEEHALGDSLHVYYSPTTESQEFLSGFQPDLELLLEQNK